jgi:PhzF family phenazine biosynthesis protein
MRLQFQTVDVFTGTQFVGNPLAVVLNAEGLSTGQMQAISDVFRLEVSKQPAVSILPYAEVHEADIDIRAGCSRRTSTFPRTRRPAPPTSR